MATAFMERQHTEGPVARTIEKQTAKIPSDVFLWAAVGSMATSATLQLMGNRHVSLFVGQWAPITHAWASPPDNVVVLSVPYPLLKKSRVPSCDHVGALAIAPSTAARIGMESPVSICVIQGLIEFALGRPIGFRDEPLIDDMITQAGKKDLAMREFIHALVSSKEFHTK